MYSKCAILLVVLSLGLVASGAFTDLFTPSANVAIRWNHLHYEIIRAAGYPLLTGRALAVVNGVVYDTWSFFDNKANQFLITISNGVEVTATKLLKLTQRFQLLHGE